MRSRGHSLLVECLLVFISGYQSSLVLISGYQSSLVVISGYQYSLVVVEANDSGYPWWLLAVASMGFFGNIRLTGINPPKRGATGAPTTREQTWVNDPI